jgi:HAE1 family hydrophobic/amphiphilic exporter-1
MSLPEIAIRRPVFSWMLMLGLIFFGWISLQRLGISQMPDVDFPVLNVSVIWEGAAPEVLEAEIVDRLEQAVTTVEGIREVASSIRQGQATLTLEFNLSRDVDAALQETQSAISRVRLPTGVDPPTIRKSNPDDQPIIWVGVGSTTRSLHELITFVDLSVRDQFQILPGVGEVQLGGFTDRSLRVWVENKRLIKNQLSILDVKDALARGHIEAAAGIIENDKQEINLRVMGEGSSPEEVAEILITTRGGKPIFGPQLRLKDVARVEDGLADIRRVSLIEGKPAVALGIKKQRGANAVAVGDLVKQRIKELQGQLPQDIFLRVNFDSTIFVREAVEETEFTLLLSALVTGLVCWLFLGSLRPTFNILLSIPTSIVGTFTVIYFMGFTLNLFTILGLALAIGIVVDDAIMVLENIYRHRAMGKSMVAAARDGATEISFAAVAASIAVVAIFLPVAFMEGVIGKFFFQFGITISVAVLLSLLEAVTLMPMRASQMRDSESRGRMERVLDKIFAVIGRAYGALLSGALRARWLVILFSGLLFAGSLKLLPLLRQEFIPPQDQGTFIVRIETPVGSSLAFTSEVLEKADEYLRSRPDVARSFIAVGGFGGGEVNSGIAFVTLKDKSSGRAGQTQIMNEVRAGLGKLPNARVFIQDLSTRGFTAQRSFPVEVNLRGPDWRVLSEKSAELMKVVSASGLVVDLNSDYRLGQPEVRVWPDRAAAAARGVAVDEIVEAVNAAMGGIRQGKFTQDGRRYDVRLRLRGEERLSPDDILNLQVRNTFGELIPLKEVVRVESTSTLLSITRRNRERSVSIFGNVAPGKSQAAALALVESEARKILPAGYRVFLGGGAQTFKESFESLYFVLWIGVVVAYMVLASQFNSYLDPITVLIALPFSLTGALAALWLSNQSINLYSVIGIVLLMGIVKKNSIMLVEFINHCRDEGMSLREAIVTASPIRLRPILMTSAATIAAAIPPALALGPGAESRIPMSITIVGGVAVSTFFTLFVVPCVYSVLARWSAKRGPSTQVI